ncbi:hypothetical protein [Hansschlegelia sp. KR7-227]|uniref:hypothetical protein n=1 Tax=Hansschlegelia sp. KR7-227 TaxID=3400914 RepID=UPI003C10DD26
MRPIAERRPSRHARRRTSRAAAGAAALPLIAIAVAMFETTFVFAVGQLMSAVGAAP